LTEVLNSSIWNGATLRSAKPGPKTRHKKMIEFALFDAIYEMLDLGRISGEDVIVVFHRRRSRRSYARQKRTPRPERKYFLFS
jgi:hypothetical protein